MTARDFVYWLQGVYELGNPKSFDRKQVAQIKAHLALVFEHDIDPATDGGDPEVKAALDKIHDGLEGKSDTGHSHGYVEPPRYRC